MWSAISPGDLGLKAGFWTRKKEDPLTFREIVGWVSIATRVVPNPAVNGFYAVILSNSMHPSLAMALEGYCGVFLKNMAAPDAKVRAMEWLDAKPGAEPQPNVKGVGQA